VFIPFTQARFGGLLFNFPFPITMIASLTDYFGLIPDKSNFDLDHVFTLTATK
jgi:hypothetical protein